jgi:hypothetical protein
VILRARDALEIVLGRSASGAEIRGIRAEGGALDLDPILGMPERRPRTTSLNFHPERLA